MPIVAHLNPVVSDAKSNQPHFHARCNSDDSLAATVWARMARAGPKIGLVC